MLDCTHGFNHISIMR
ncbi:CRISPR-associated DxTHG motif protein [Acinetobacter sp. Ac_3412]